MKNKTNEANKYECVLCETGEGSTHGLQCSKNKANKISIKLSKSSILRLLKGEVVEAGDDTTIEGYCLDKAFEYKGRIKGLN